MEISRLVLFFFLRTAIGALPIAYAILFSPAPAIVKSYRWPLAYLIALGIYAIYQVFLFPKYFSPYRMLPAVKEHKPGQIIFESPRGKTPLGWMRANPNADLLVSYGPFNIPTLIPCSAEALRDIMNTNSYDFQKPWGLRAFLARALGFGLILTEGAEHKRQRKLLTPAFNIRKIRELYGLMWERTQSLLVNIAKDVKAHPIVDGYGKVEMTDWASRLTLDIIGPTAMGQDFKSLENEEHPVSKAFEELLEPRTDALVLLGAHWAFPEYILRRLPFQINSDINRITGYLRKECTKYVKEKKASLKDKVDDNDILGEIIKTGEFTDELLVDEMLTFLAAGHETTANALTWACYLCAKHPIVQQRVREEIRATIPSASSEITHEILENMPYLNGVCEETLRMYPTVPVTVREAINDTTVANIPITKGTQFVLNPFAINRHPKYWGDNADEMVPERWIDIAKDGSKRPNKNGGTSTNFSEITFLHGPRSCIGRDFAKAELRCAVAGMLGRFEFKLDTEEYPLIVGVITMRAKGGVFLRLKELQGW